MLKIRVNKVLSMALALLVVAGSFSLPSGSMNIGGKTAITASAEKIVSGDYEYELRSDGTAVIKGYNGAESDLNIPSELDGYTVTAIADLAFAERSDITSVTFPDSVENIRSYAFAYCENLASVTFGSGVEAIGYYAFTDCTALSSVTFGDSVEFIGGWSFQNCTALESVSFGNNVEYIGSSAFEGCGALTSVTVPDSVETIDYRAFRDCAALTSVTIGSGVEYIGSYAFDGCSALTEISIKSKKCTIYDNAGTINDSAVIYGYANSTAQAYAEKYGRSFVPIVETVGAVNGLTVKSASTDSVTLGWTATAGAGGYIIEKKVGSNWERVAKIANNATTSYAVTGIAYAGKTYTFRIKAYKNVDGTAIYSDYTEIAASTTPGEVKGLTAKSDAVKAVSLNWTKDSYTAGYIIEKKVGNNWERVTKIATNATTSYTVTGLANSNKSYTFRIKTYKNDNGEVIYGEPVSVSATTK